MVYLVLYDVVDTKRHARIIAVLKDYGIQTFKSAFEVAAGESVFLEMKKRLEKVIDPAQDNVTIFKICEACQARKCQLGVQKKELVQENWIII